MHIFIMIMDIVNRAHQNANIAYKKILTNVLLVKRGNIYKTMSVQTAQIIAKLVTKKIIVKHAKWAIFLKMGVVHNVMSLIVLNVQPQINALHAN